MKKLTFAFLLSLSCACVALGAASCVSNEPASSSSSSSKDGLTVKFVAGDGYKFLEDVDESKTYKTGDVISFDLNVSAFYTGYAVVYANGSPVQPKDGSYTFTLTESVEFTVDGIQKDVSNMPGDGSFDNAFVVSKPVDLIYIAEQVNAGNPSYVNGAYVLANDIDCGGEELQVIGDLSTEYSYFSGCFTIASPEENSEMQRHTISNFKIDSVDTNYVGLFGAVYADASVQSSGLFYGICLDNFSISARNSSDDRSIVAGSLIGYGVGATVYLCDATNGILTVHGDTAYFSYAGGLIGYQQGFSLAEQGLFFPSEVSYCVVDVDVNIIEGMGLYAGGISGYLASNSAFGSTAYIHNSYATGNVLGALRSGGIAGGLGQYSSIGNSYATGRVSATARQSVNSPGLTDVQYAFANAGGIVGYAENDSIVSDSFTTSTVRAISETPNNWSTGEIVGGGAAKGTASASSSQYIIYNCLGAKDIDLSNKNFFSENLSWHAGDWTFKADAYPTIFYGSPEGILTASLTLEYVANGNPIEVKGDTTSGAMKFFDTSTQSSNIYAPIGNYFQNGYLDVYMKSDVDGYLAYGYFFDKECTRKVPYSYVPQKDITLYIGFKDCSPIVGTYYVYYGNSTDSITLTFDKDGIVTYTDGNTEQKSNYLYDGETVAIEGTRLARYFQGEIEVDENDTTSIQDAYFDMARYSYYNFAGSVNDGVLTVYDGTYFTKDAPLTAIKKVLFHGAYTDENGTTYEFQGDTVTVTPVGEAPSDHRFIIKDESIFIIQSEEVSLKMEELQIALEPTATFLTGSYLYNDVLYTFTKTEVSFKVGNEEKSLPYEIENGQIKIEDFNDLILISDLKLAKNEKIQGSYSYNDTLYQFTQTTVTLKIEGKNETYFYTVSNGVITIKGIISTDTVLNRNDLIDLENEFFRGEYYDNNGTEYKFYGDKVLIKPVSEAQSEYAYTYANGVITLENDQTINEADLNQYDNFKGVWSKSATTNKTYRFDGKGVWSDGSARGEYTVNGNSIALSNGKTARFNADGFLEIDGQNYYAEGSYVGTWKANDLTLELWGIGNKGYGNATVTYTRKVGVRTEELKYELIYEVSETNGYVALYYPHDEFVKDTLFGYFTYGWNGLSATLFDPQDATTGYRQVTLGLTDDYVGEWIVDTQVNELIGCEFIFDGNGLINENGELTVIDANGADTKVPYVLEDNMQGKFTYNDVTYVMIYDELTHTVTITHLDGNEILKRKDELANVNFIDWNGMTYSFDGRSSLSTKTGMLTLGDGTEYLYKAETAGWSIWDGANNVGTLFMTDNCYTLTINSVETQLYVTNEFMGEWAVNDKYGILKVGPTDLDGVIHATYLGNEIRMTFVDVGLYEFNFRDDNMPITYYVYIVNDERLGSDLLVLSEYTSLSQGNYTICTKANELFGSWIGNNGFTLHFDGVSTGSYTYGHAKITRKTASATAYNYTLMTDNGALMWSQAELAGGRTYYFKIELLDVATMSQADKNAENVYVQKDKDGNVIKAIRSIEADSLTFTNVTDADEHTKTYLFDADNEKGLVIKLADEIVYTYELTEYDDSTKLGTLHLTDKNGVVYEAILNLKADDGDEDPNTPAITIDISSEPWVEPDKND